MLGLFLCISTDKQSFLPSIVTFESFLRISICSLCKLNLIYFNETA